jgi:hypothetical protein
VTVLESISVLTCVVSDCSCGASDVTCVVVVTAPMRILKSRRAVWLSTSVRLDCMDDWKPGASAFT